MNRLSAFGLLLCLLGAPSLVHAADTLRVTVVTEKTVPEWMGQIVSKRLEADFNLVRLEREAKVPMRKLAKRWTDGDETDLVVHLTSWRKRRRAFLQITLFDGHRDKVIRLITRVRGRFRNRKIQIRRNRVKRVADIVANKIQAPAAEVKAYLEAQRSGDAEVAPPPVAEVKAPPPPIYEPEDPHRFIQARAGVFAGGRRFIYNDFLYGQLREFDLPATALLGLEARIIPFSKSRAGFLSGLAAEFAFVTSLGISAGAADSDTEDNQVDSQWLDVTVGISWLTELTEGLSIGPYAGANYSSYTFADLATTSSQTTDQAPDAEYFSAAGGLRTELVFGSVQLEVTGAAVLPFDYGSFMEETFPNVGGFGVVGRGGVRYLVSETFSIGVDGLYERFGLSFDPEPGASAVAGGATDQYWRAGWFAALSL